MIELGSILNKHKGSNIIVCGCGESATLLVEPHRNITIGVNDIQRLFSPNYLVVVNDKVSFSQQRWSFIESTQAQVIFTHLRGMKVDDARKCVITLGRYGACELDKPAIDYTSNSPYIAVILAYKMGAKNIGLLGVDFTPNHFFAKTGDHPLSKKAGTISNEYVQLHRALANKNVGFYNLSPVSKIMIPKMHLDDFQNMQ
jgi:hypothetical protein